MVLSVPHFFQWRWFCCGLTYFSDPSIAGSWLEVLHFLDINIDVLRHGVQKEVWTIHCVEEDCLYNSFPTCVEPVKEMPATKGDSQRSCPTPAVLLLLDVTTLMTPGGIPASSAREANARADRG